MVDVVEVVLAAVACSVVVVVGAAPSVVRIAEACSDGPLVVS